MRTALLAAFLAATSFAAKPKLTATILVRVNEHGEIIDRRAASDRYAQLRHRGWIKAIRPPGVCIRTALFNNRPAWIEWTWMGPIVWDKRGADYFRQHFAHLNLLPASEGQREGMEAALALMEMDEAEEMSVVRGWGG